MTLCQLWIHISIQEQLIWLFNLCAYFVRMEDIDNHRLHIDTQTNNYHISISSYDSVGFLGIFGVVIWNDGTTNVRYKWKTIHFDSVSQWYTFYRVMRNNAINVWNCLLFIIEDWNDKAIFAFCILNVFSATQNYHFIFSFSFFFVSCLHSVQFSCYFLLLWIWRTNVKNSNYFWLRGIRNTPQTLSTADNADNNQATIAYCTLIEEDRKTRQNW